MDRRENLKVLITGTVATGLLISTGCKDDKEVTNQSTTQTYLYGRTPEEEAVDKKLLSETFFTEKERKMVEILSDIIIPADDVSCSANEAGVPDFIEFMMKDDKKLQVPVRGGLMWLENFSLATFDKSFDEITPDQRIVLIDQIAWPDKAEAAMKPGVKFFNVMRNLTCTGFFTSKEGIKDIGYLGNRPNQWDGVPPEVMQKYGFSYDEKTLTQCLKIEDQHKIIQWDAEGNIIG
ncbi:MAG: gluconate 2-dehydrogenase subunit 3 family protein [Saprospiraceae bacterium]|jgi:gluconate 2-dehydrogenase gamma chain|nr:gluconate 2-dehydrogenase subunit 3 family protein [Saprospiraceae bacterium]